MAHYPQKRTFRDDICESIDAALLKKPSDFEAFLRLLEADGYEIKRGKNIALKGKGQQRFIRLRSLGEGYSEEELRAAVAGEAVHQPKRSRKEKSFSTAPPKLQLLIDIEAKRAEGKGRWTSSGRPFSADRSGAESGYVRWANNFNLKQMAEAVCFIKEHGIDTYEELAEKTDAAAVRFNELSASIKRRIQAAAFLHRYSK